MIPRFLIGIVLALSLACGTQYVQSTPAPARGPVRVSPDSIAEVVLERRSGMGGFGATYSYRFRFDGEAEYEGGLNALFRGSYTAPLDIVARRILQSLVTRRQLQHSDEFCEDAPSATIRLVLTTGSIVTVTAACGAPRSNIEFAAELDSLGSTVRWHPAEAVPPNMGLLQPGPSTPLFSLAWRVRR